MILQHILLAFRQLRRNKFGFFIAIICLSLSLVATAHFVSYALFHFDYDKEVSDPSQWYRLRYSSHIPDYRTVDSAKFFFIPLINAIDDLPEIKDYTFIWETPISLNLRCDDKPFFMDSHGYTTKSLPKHYRMQALWGNPESLMTEKNDMIISESLSRRLFGSDNPVGKEVKGPNQRTLYTISGVFKDLPENLHIKQDSYILWTDRSDEADESDLDFEGHVRLRIPDKADLSQVERKIEKILRDHPYIHTLSGEISVHLEPISKMHFMTGLKDDEPTFSKLNLYSIIFLAVIALIVALINFVIIIGLSWTKRSEEFYFRRTLGASRMDIGTQLFIESGVYYLISAILGIVFYLLTIDIFKAVVSMDFSGYNLLGMTLLPWSLIALVSLGIVVALMMIWRFSAKILLEQSANAIRDRDFGNKLLLFIQMLFGFIFITAAIGMGIQYRSIYTLNWGYNGENTIEYQLITMYQNAPPGYISGKLLEDRLKEIKGVTKVSLSSFSLASGKPELTGGIHEVFVYFEDEQQASPYVSKYSACLPSFFETRELELIKGSFPKEDTWTTCVVNQSFVESFFKDEEPIGKKLKMDEEMDFWFEIVGVIADTRFFPAHHAIEPMFILGSPYSPAMFQQISWQEGQKQRVLKEVEDTYAEVTKNGFFGYSSQEIEHAQDEFYREDRMYKNISIFYSIFVCLIALMGVYAISSATIFAQMKDISIRKISGAELPDLVWKYSKSTLYIFLIAALLGLMIASQIISQYFQRFAFRTNVSGLAYPLSFILMALVVFIPIYLNVLKAFKADVARYLQSD